MGSEEAGEAVVLAVLATVLRRIRRKYYRETFVACPGCRLCEKR